MNFSRGVFAQRIGKKFAPSRPGRTLEARGGLSDLQEIEPKAA